MPTERGGSSRAFAFGVAVSCAALSVVWGSVGWGLTADELLERRLDNALKQKSYALEIVGAADGLAQSRVRYEFTIAPAEQFQGADSAGALPVKAKLLSRALWALLPTGEQTNFPTADHQATLWSNRMVVRDSPSREEGFLLCLANGLLFFTFESLESEGTKDLYLESGRRFGVRTPCAEIGFATAEIESMSNGFVHVRFAKPNDFQGVASPYDGSCMIDLQTGWTENVDVIHVQRTHRIILRRIRE
jgi:hypothetical protein